jgi:hypothetical protein
MLRGCLGLRFVSLFQTSRSSPSPAVPPLFSLSTRPAHYAQFSLPNQNLFSPLTWNARYISLNPTDTEMEQMDKEEDMWKDFPDEFKNQGPPPDVEQRYRKKSKKKSKKYDRDDDEEYLSTDGSDEPWFDPDLGPPYLRTPLSENEVSLFLR